VLKTFNAFLVHGLSERDEIWHDGVQSEAILVNFGALFRYRKFSTSDISRISCRSATKFGSVNGLPNRNLFLQFREFWCRGPAIPCGDNPSVMHLFEDNFLQWRAPNGSVAMSMIRRQRTRSLAFLQAEWIPMLADCTSTSIPLSQVVRGRPQGVSWWSERRTDSSVMILPGIK